MDEHTPLSRRERQIMAVIYARGASTATDVLEHLPDPPSRTTVRTLLRILEEKGHLKHTKSGREFVYQPVRQRRRAGKAALKGVLSTFFDGSLEKAVAAHFSDPGIKVSREELRKLSVLIKDLKKRGD
jgi:predicted transcriptional regulator